MSSPPETERPYNGRLPLRGGEAAVGAML